MNAKKAQTRYSPELRERAVRMVLVHRNDYPTHWVAIEAMAPKFGCAPQTLHEGVKKAETDAGVRPRLTSDERAKMKAVEREIKELCQANEILRKASAFFAQAERAKNPWAQTEVMIAFIDQNRDEYGLSARQHSMRGIDCAREGRSAECFRSPLRRITRTTRGAAALNERRRACCATWR